MATPAFEQATPQNGGFKIRVSNDCVSSHYLLCLEKTGNLIVNLAVYHTAQMF